MDVLKKMYESLHYQNIQTYVQSGNVIFAATEKNPKEIEKAITLKIENEFGFEVPVIVLTVSTLKTIIKNNPLIDNQKDASFFHVTFLADIPTQFAKEDISGKKQPNEAIEFTSNAVYLYCPDGYGKTRLNNNFLENKLKVKATTRNWKTVAELLKIASK